uniref:Pollen-specific protein C13-like n=1 Tax=Elaeis guineensis var. tenera TaxID=51953 RepID=A0A6I9QAY6_ELAGV|nr:pollen-specific protein C13-like [Elaeis guineensis]
MILLASDSDPLKLHGAKVRLECRSRTTGAKTCSFDGVTDRSGTYNILVADEHEHETCEAVLVSSPVKGCAETLEGRERARVFLTNNNGIASTKRFANSLGFQRDIALAGCAQLLKMYPQYENEVQV